MDGFTGAVHGGFEGGIDPARLEFYYLADLLGRVSLLAHNVSGWVIHHQQMMVIFLIRIRLLTRLFLAGQVQTIRILVVVHGTTTSLSRFVRAHASLSRPIAPDSHILKLMISVRARIIAEDGRAPEVHQTSLFDK